MAQDFYAAFGLGNTNKGMATIVRRKTQQNYEPSLKRERVGTKPFGDIHAFNNANAQGVAFAAIQGLYQLVQEQQEKIEALESQLANR